MFTKLAISSLIERKGSVMIAILAMTVSVFVLMGVDHIRHQAKESFSKTISGVDLIVGAKTGDINLLLYSVFRIGSPTNNVRWETYQTVAGSRHVEWSIPLSLGDSHKGFRVLGTTADYFSHFSYGRSNHLFIKDGTIFNQVYEVVLGSEVANKLNYQLGDKLILSHGIVSTSFNNHKEHPFTVVGILSATGTPVDHTVHVSLQGIEAIHIGFQQPGKKTEKIENTALDNELLQPQSITGFMVGLKSKMMTFRLQRQINNYKKEPLLAILPGVVLAELWQMMRVLENTLRLVSALVFFSAALGVSAVLLSSIRERSQEVQLLRVIGAPPRFLFFLVQLEALLITFVSLLLGSSLLTLCLLILRPILASSLGLTIDINIFNLNAMVSLAMIVVVSIFAAVIPAINVYRKAISVSG